MEYNVTIQWDMATQNWIAISEEIMGAIWEDASFDSLVDKIKDAMPELLQLNDMPPMSMLCIKAEYREWIA